MMDLIYNIEDGYDINHNLTIACPNRGIDNLMVLLNNINNTVVHDAPNTTNNEISNCIVPYRQRLAFPD
jgi:hypothetical protein